MHFLLAACSQLCLLSSSQASCHVPSLQSVRCSPTTGLQWVLPLAFCRGFQISSEKHVTNILTNQSPASTICIIANVFLHIKWKTTQCTVEKLIFSRRTRLPIVAYSKPSAYSEPSCISKYLNFNYTFFHFLKSYYRSL